MYSSWAGAGGGWALHDGECGGEDDAGGGGAASFASAAVGAADRAAGGTWLGFAFEKPVAPRCVAVCQSGNVGERAESVTLERSSDGASWTPHATIRAAETEPIRERQGPQRLGTRVPGTLPSRSSGKY